MTVVGSAFRRTLFLLGPLMSTHLTRRDLLKASLLTPLAAGAHVPSSAAAANDAGKRLRGVFIILNTPFTSTGDVAWADLEREVDFVRRGGCSGIVWPQGSSGVTTLTREERLRGMQVLATAGLGQRRVQVAAAAQAGQVGGGGAVARKQQSGCGGRGAGGLGRHVAFTRSGRWRGQRAPGCRDRARAGARATPSSNPRRGASPAAIRG